MITPSTADLLERPDLVPKLEIAEHLSEAVAATARFQRNSTVTVTYKVNWDDKTERLFVGSVVKSKRPVRPNRNEEVIGNDENILALKAEIPGQQTI